LELSAELAERQHQRLQAELPQLAGRVQWLDRLPTAFTGCIVGNEVLDAMPCQLVHKTKAGWRQRGVAWSDGPTWLDGPPLAEPFASQLDRFELPDGYVTELQPEAAAFVASLADITTAGALLLPDYGFAEAEYYHPQRHRGTLMCHYRHHSHDNPFHLPGLEDITTHVDFSAIWRAADAAGWQLEGYTSQASYLLDAGLLDCLAQTPADSPTYAKLAATAHTLTSPAEMGELFKVIAFSKGYTPAALLRGFRRDDRSGLL
jgi:SAM-dependent MidA family methyltransferase